MASKPSKIGMRALTMQQPFAAAMAAGVGLYSRRGRATKFGNQAKHAKGERFIGVVEGSNKGADSGAEGEWLAIHCGQNNEHLNNDPLMKRIRAHWPECPPEEELKAAQKCILGAALFVDGSVAGKTAASACPVLREYPCAKPMAWRAAEGRALDTPVPYPKGQVQVWHVYKHGFTDGPADAEKLLALAAASSGKSQNEKKKRAHKIKTEQRRQLVKEEPPAEAPPPKRKPGKRKGEPTVVATTKKKAVKKEEKPEPTSRRSKRTNATATRRKKR